VTQPPPTGNGLSVECVRTAGQFTLDGSSWDVTNNVWLLGSGNEVLVVDAAHDASAVARAVGGRKAIMVFCTHGHSDHVNAAPELADLLDAPVALHLADLGLWGELHGDRRPDIFLSDGDVVRLGNHLLRVLHTPGHTPGGVCLSSDEQGELWSGDTLFRGGPGATGRRDSHFGTIIESIRSSLLALDPRTVVHPGHGDDTTIGAEAPHLQEWIVRGH
jgi:glyoxylase-like metal-dependent hydrolase (beta-lactamase superfamily II)